jgi:hypothetical protein
VRHLQPQLLRVVLGGEGNGVQYLSVFLCLCGGMQLTDWTDFSQTKKSSLLSNSLALLLSSEQTAFTKHNLRKSLTTLQRFGLWGKDAEDASSNYQELWNLVETVEQEAGSRVLEGNELWIFTNNSTAKSCFMKGDSKSEKLNALVLQLRMVELRSSFTLHVVHPAGTCMIAHCTRNGWFVVWIISQRSGCEIAC